jgi:hypothetical protein
MLSASRLWLLAALLMPAHAAAQSVSPAACHAEIQKTEVTIAEARKQPEYHNERGRHVLATADRWVNQARRHAAKGESRGCVVAAQRGRTECCQRGR